MTNPRDQEDDGLLNGHPCDDGVGGAVCPAACSILVRRLSSRSVREAIYIN
eukprot:COSAG02_NODE_3733_length_6312_cov_3.880251_1_plen_50_part_10